MTTTGGFDLKTRTDLLQKLRHDFSRVKKNWADSYAAFDFFVTAFHMEDWPPVGTPAPCTDSEYEEALKNVCSHLANGLKHFEFDPGRRQSIKGTELVGSAFDPHAFSPEGFQIGYLVIHLEEDAAKALGMDPVLDVITLASKVLAYWETSGPNAPQRTLFSQRRGNEKKRK